MTGETGSTAPTVESIPGTGRLTHVDEKGRARMVDVTGKAMTARRAEARCTVRTTAPIAGVLAAGLRTGAELDHVAAARVAGIHAAKVTSDLIPLCHPLSVHGVEVNLEVHDDGVGIEAVVRTTERTGVEMEALTAVTVAALALIDMVKAVDKAATIECVRLEEKTGGKSGPWRRAVTIQ